MPRFVTMTRSNGSNPPASAGASTIDVPHDCASENGGGDDRTADLLLALRLSVTPFTHERRAYRESRSVRDRLRIAFDDQVPSLQPRSELAGRKATTSGDSIVMSVASR
jgi:hypothetical protein